MTPVLVKKPKKYAEYGQKPLPTKGLAKNQDLGYNPNAYLRISAKNFIK